MNANEFNAELTGLIGRAMAEGVTQNKMGVDSIVGILDLQKMEIIRWAQDMARAAAAKAQPTIHLPTNGRIHGLK